MRWGLVPMWAKDVKIGNQAINARLDSVATKPMFHSAWKSRRCLIPASGYFEWRELAVPDQMKPAKMPFYVTRKDGVPLTFAGLWERWGPDSLSPSSRPAPQMASGACTRTCRSSCPKMALSPGCPAQILRSILTSTRQFKSHPSRPR
jgi:putative SOS response-associated peptidase YedK